MNITADTVKQLRERTGAGFMECKKALVETQGNLDAAAELMRKSGLAKADKKASRVAAEGTVAIERTGNHAALVEVNCETDFVARSDEFQAFANAVAAAALRAAATAFAKAWNSSLRATKSVSQLTSTSAAWLPVRSIATVPSAATREAFLSAFANPLLRINSAAASKLP